MIYLLNQSFGESFGQKQNPAVFIRDLLVYNRLLDINNVLLFINKPPL
jgi:hypothetical protein